MKCDLCADRVAQGEQPICVEACPLRALDFGEISELREKYGEWPRSLRFPVPTRRSRTS